MTDYKKTQKALYQPATEPSIIDVPEMAFAAIDGRGDPNTSAEYAAAVETLYALSYAIKMKKDWPAYFDYVVPPLEGFWTCAGETAAPTVIDKSRFLWTMLIRQPEFVAEDLFAKAREIAAKKKPGLDFAKARLERFAEGLCVQIMHIGPYDDEPRSIRRLAVFAAENGFREDFATRRHHEIYLSDPRKTAPDKLKTVLRHPIAKLY
ncbi:MAG: GyrI-like domain-containing protein [Gracilibacteraceae bacterium]|jgi:hypothetical protein|nr:GyrI-like domain-containing protein [Gracilibacteraceae bacterium]